MVGFMSTEESDSPDYEELETGVLGHVQVIQVMFNPNELTFEELCKYFFSVHDPT